MRAGSVAAALVLTLLPATVLAQGTSKDAVAEGLFQEAKKLLAAGKVPAACEKFKASLDVDRASGTLTALAFCHQREGRTASAWAEYTEVAAEAKRAGKADQEKYALQQIAAMEKVLRKVTIRVPSVPGLAITIDGVEIPASALGTPVPVDPGTRTFEAAAPKHIAASKKVELAPGPGVTEVELPALVSEPVAPPPPVAAPAPAKPPVPAGADSTRLVLGGGLALAGAAAIGVGAYLQFVVARRQQDTAVDRMLVAYDPVGSQASHDKALTSSTAGITCMGVGAAALGLGGYLLVSAFSTKTKMGTARARFVSPYATADQAGMLVGGEL